MSLGAAGPVKYLPGITSSWACSGCTTPFSTLQTGTSPAELQQSTVDSGTSFGAGHRKSFTRLGARSATVSTFCSPTCLEQLLRGALSELPITCLVELSPRGPFLSTFGSNVLGVTPVMGFPSYSTDGLVSDALSDGRAGL
jgi:hypothetical protein